jgi:hypothetical protein
MGQMVLARSDKMDQMNDAGGPVNLLLFFDEAETRDSMQIGKSPIPKKVIGITECENMDRQFRFQPLNKRDGPGGMTKAFTANTIGQDRFGHV